MHETRKLLRALLSALIARQENAGSLYIPRGEAGQVRMIRALLEANPLLRLDPELTGMITAFEAQFQAHGQ